MSDNLIHRDICMRDDLDKRLFELANRLNIGSNRLLNRMLEIAAAHVESQLNRKVHVNAVSLEGHYITTEGD
jgi:hypothetical protein